jgi:hypothetical protein
MEGGVWGIELRNERGWGIQLGIISELKNGT